MKAFVSETFYLLSSVTVIPSKVLSSFFRAKSFQRASQFKQKERLVAAAANRVVPSSIKRKTDITITILLNLSIGGPLG